MAGAIRIVSVTKEPAAAITGYKYLATELVREGYPHMAAADFVAMLIKANGNSWAEAVNRIEFEYLD